MDWLQRFLLIRGRDARANSLLGFDAAGDVEIFPQGPVEAAQALVSVLLFGEGAPEDAAQASLTVNPVGDDNSLTFTAVAFGAGGNDITIEYVDPSDAEIPLSVAVAGSAIVVTLETDDQEAIVTTAADILAAIEADEDADALVTVAIDTADSGSGDDGSGVVTAMEATALEGGEGNGIGVALPGALFIDTDGGDVYRNSGSQAEPAWAQLADAA